MASRDSRGLRRLPSAIWSDYLTGTSQIMKPSDGSSILLEFVAVVLTRSRVTTAASPGSNVLVVVPTPSDVVTRLPFSAQSCCELPTHPDGVERRSVHLPDFSSREIRYSIHVSPGSL